jgi:tetratricopeptide (TPR) repeat protein
MLLALGIMSSGEDPVEVMPQAIRALAMVRWLSRRHPEVTESFVGAFTNVIWAGLRRDRAGSFWALETARESSDPWTRYMAGLAAAMFRENEGDVEQMEADLELSIDGFRELGDRWGTSMALRGLASYQSNAGDHAGALRSLEEALRLIQELGTTEGVGQLIGMCANSRMELGDLEGARADLENALRMSDETGSRGGQGMALLGMARIALRAGRLDEAKELAERAYGMLDLKVERIAPHGQAMMLAHLSRIDAYRGDLESARRYNRQAVELALGTEDMPVAASVVETMADVDLLAGEAEPAARTMGIAASMRGMRSLPDADVRSTHERLHDALGNEAFDEAYEAGAALARDDAVAEVRKRISSS